MKSKRKLTKEERYILDHMGGARIALILQIRDVLFKCLHLKEKEQGYTLNKATINKIKREIDVPWIGKIINVIYKRRNGNDIMFSSERLWICLSTLLI